MSQRSEAETGILHPRMQLTRAVASPRSGYLGPTSSRTARISRCSGHLGSQPEVLMCDWCEIQSQVHSRPLAEVFLSNRYHDWIRVLGLGRTDRVHVHANCRLDLGWIMVECTPLLRMRRRLGGRPERWLEHVSHIAWR